MRGGGGGGATGNSSADKSNPDQYDQAVLNEERINKLLAEPTEFVYSDNYNYGGTLDSRPVGSYWSATVGSATGSRNLGFSTDGTARSLYPQSNYGKGNAFAVRCVSFPNKPHPFFKFFIIR